MGRQETIATDEEWHGWRYEQREWHDTREENYERIYRYRRLCLACLLSIYVVSVVQASTRCLCSAYRLSHSLQSIVMSRPLCVCGCISINPLSYRRYALKLPFR